MTLSATKSKRISFESLRLIPAPRGTATWTPVKHSDYVEEMISALDRHGMRVDTAEYAVSHDNLKLFGVLNFADDGGEFARSIGFRASNDKTISLHAVAGARVFVCDNMMLSGESISFRRKHTAHLNMRQTVNEGIERYLRQQEQTLNRIDRIKSICLSDDEAKAALYDLLRTKVLPAPIIETAHMAYFDKQREYPDCEPRSLYGLHNACTRAAKQLHPARQFETTMHLGEVFHL